MATTTPLSERIVPTRRAAKRASAVFAEQVQNSPGHSDDEPHPSDSFGEPPSRRQPNVKYRYNAKGKFRASPLKQTESPSPSTKHQSRPKHQRTPKPTTPSHPQSSLQSKKRKASASLLDREDTASTLTALSPSPFPSRSTSPVIPTKKLPPLSTTPLPKLGTRGGSMRSIGASSSKKTSLSKSLSQSSLRKKKVDNAKTYDQVNGFHFGDVDTLVWVLVNELGVAATTVTQDDDDIVFLEKKMWWPARIVQREPLRVTLFGDLALSREPSTIPSPSECNIKPVHNLFGERRFSCATFQVSSPQVPESSNPSPRKKAKIDICERWEAAVKAMENADELKRDGMPEMISAYTGGTSLSGDEDMDDLRAAQRSLSQSGKLHSPESKASLRSKGKSKADTPHDEFEVPTDRAWSPPPPDPTLQLPGELVLAQALRTRSKKYWPAQLISYVPATKPGGKQRYRAKFLDDEEYDLTRDKFWTSEEEVLLRVTWANFESAVQDVEAPDSENEADEPKDKERSPSPQLADPPPTADDFADLPMRAQLAYVKPVLKAILHGKYAPASKKHESFMRGGAARSSLMKRAAVRGGLDPIEVKQLQRLISRWTLGEGYARRTNRELKPLEVMLPPEQDIACCATSLAVNGDSLAEADTAKAHVTSPSDRMSRDGLSQAISTSDDICNQVDNSGAMTDDKPDQFNGSSKLKTHGLPSASLQNSESCIPALMAVLAAGKADEVSAVPHITGNDVMSQPILLSDIRNQIDDDSMVIDQADEPSKQSLHENVRRATNLAADDLANIHAGKTDGASENASHDDRSQSISLSDIRNQVDDANAMVVDKPLQDDNPLKRRVDELPSLRDQIPTPKEDVPEQSNLGDNPESRRFEVESRIPSRDQQRPEGSQEYKTLSTLDKLDYCVNILLPEAIQQLLLWRSGERTSTALFSPEEEERLHERGEAKAQETDWVYDLLRLREAQARLWGVGLKAKGKEKNKGDDVKGPGGRVRGLAGYYLPMKDR